MIVLTDTSDNESKALSFRSPAFLYGASVFETLRVYDGGYLFLLDDHLQRLRSGLRYLGWAPSNELDQWLLDIEAMMKVASARFSRQHRGHGRLRLTCYLDEKTRVRFRVEIVPAPPVYPDRWAASAVLTSFAVHPGPLSGIKSGNRLHFEMARRQARQSDADEALLVNDSGELAEGSTANVFLVSRGVILTPPLSANILPGVTRKAIIQAADELCLPLRQVAITPSVLQEADEVFLTNSVVEVLPVITIGPSIVGRGVEGRLTEKLRRFYRRCVKEKRS